MIYETVLQEDMKRELNLMDQNIELQKKVTSKSFNSVQSMKDENKFILATIKHCKDLIDLRNPAKAAAMDDRTNDNKSQLSGSSPDKNKAMVGTVVSKGFNILDALSNADQSELG